MADSGGVQVGELGGRRVVKSRLIEQVTLCLVDVQGHEAITVCREQGRLRGRHDLTSSAVKMTMGVIGAVAEFERDLLTGRTQAGLWRAKSEGKKLGHPSPGRCSTC